MGTYSVQKRIKEIAIAGLMVLVVLSGYGCAKLQELLELELEDAISVEEISNSTLFVEGRVSLEGNVSASGITVSASGRFLDSDMHVVTSESGHYQIFVEPEAYLLAFSKEGYKTVIKNIKIDNYSLSLETVTLEPLSQTKESTPAPLSGDEQLSEESLTHPQESDISKVFIGDLFEDVAFFRTLDAVVDLPCCF